MHSRWPCRVKPGERMPDGARGDVIGLGARRFILSLYGAKAPYTLRAAINVNDSVVSDAKLEANRWCRGAMTGEPTAGKKWRHFCSSTASTSPRRCLRKTSCATSIPTSIVLGTELFYFHSSYYRGLLGRTLVFDRAERPAASGAGQGRTLTFFFHSFDGKWRCSGQHRGRI